MSLLKFRVKTFKGGSIDLTYNRGENKVGQDLVNDAKAAAVANDVNDKLYGLNIIIDGNNTIVSNMASLEQLYDCNCSPMENDFVIVLPNITVIPTQIFDVETIYDVKAEWQTLWDAYTTQRDSDITAAEVAKTASDYTTILNQKIDERIDEKFGMETYNALSSGMKTALRDHIQGHMEKNMAMYISQAVKKERAHDNFLAINARIKTKYEEFIASDRYTTAQKTKLQTLIDQMELPP